MTQNVLHRVASAGRRTARSVCACAAASAAILAIAGAAHAAPTITVYGTDQPLPAGQRMVADFDTPVAAGFTFTPGAGAYSRSGALGLDSGVSAPPPGEVSNYFTVLGGGSATLHSDRLLDSLSFYMGSPDAYNSVRFVGPSYDVTLTGADLFSPPTAFNGDQSQGRRVDYDFGGAKVTDVIFSSTGNSFEFDSIAAGVPEPATWAMLIFGLFGMGALLRDARRKAIPLRA